MVVLVEPVKLTSSMVLKVAVVLPTALRKLAVVAVSHVLLFCPPAQVRTLEVPW